LIQLSRDLSAAIHNDSLAPVAEIAAKLDEGVQAQYGAWLVRDSNDRVADVLSWLPADVESFWVNQIPFVVHKQDPPSWSAGRIVENYSVDRLRAQDEGRYFDFLENRTIRLVIAADRGIPAPDSNAGIVIPGPIAARDVVYFYFLDRAFDSPPGDELIQGRPLWQTSAKITGPYIPRPRTEPPEVEDTNWLTVARPDLLILSSKKELLTEVLDRVLQGSSTRALPAALPEWNQVDRSAGFWGFRHYSAASKPKPGERGCQVAELPSPDCRAIGSTLSLDSAGKHLELRYLSEAPLWQQPGPADTVHTQFQVDQPQPGVWRLISDLQMRGPFPFSFAIQALGFGVYR
jgi:hypothetical protein